MNFMPATHWKSPVFSSLLEKRREGWLLLGVGGLHLGFSLAGIPFWNCPIRQATGVPCPGCGLTRAIFELLRGDLSSSLHTHAFAPLFVLALGLMFTVLILPERPGKALIALIRNVEVRSGITTIMLVSLLLYWTTRILGFIPFPNIF